MQRLIAILVIFVTVGSLSADEKKFLARFEVTQGAFDYGTPPKIRRAIILYIKEGTVIGERIEGEQADVIGLGTFESERLVNQLEKLSLPKMDYQRHFTALEKQPPKKGAAQLVTMDGAEVEVELHTGGTIVKFRMWNPETFFLNHTDDKIASKVHTAIETIILAMAKSSYYF